MCVYIS